MKTSYDKHINVTVKLAGFSAGDTQGHRGSAASGCEKFDVDAFTVLTLAVRLLDLMLRERDGLYHKPELLWIRSNKLDG